MNLTSTGPLHAQGNGGTVTRMPEQPAAPSTPPAAPPRAPYPMTEEKREYLIGGAIIISKVDVDGLWKMISADLDADKGLSPLFMLQWTRVAMHLAYMAERITWLETTLAKHIPGFRADLKKRNE